MKKSFFDKNYFRERDYLDPKIASVIKKIASDNSYKKILDVGCGTGKLVIHLNKNGFSAYGCDPYIRETLKMFHIKPKLNKFFINASATRLPFNNNSFDMVTLVSVIEHLQKKEVEKFLSEAKRVLKKNGYIFIVTPNYDSIWRKFQGKKWFGYSDPTHINFYTPETLAKLLVKYNFKKITFQFKLMDLSFLDYLVVSTFFWKVRNSFYIAGQNEKI